MADTERDKLSYGHPDIELVMALEPDQLVAESSQLLRALSLSRAANLALWVLRAFVLIITGLVVYTFVRSLR